MRRERGRQKDTATAVKRTVAGQERGREEGGGRREIRVPPMLDMPKLLEKGAHTWDRWEVFTLKPEYQMAS